MVALDHITLAPLGATPQIPVPCRPALRRPPLPPRPEPVGGQVDDKFPTTGRPRVRVGTGKGLAHVRFTNGSEGGRAGGLASACQLSAPQSDNPGGDEPGSATRWCQSQR